LHREQRFALASSFKVKYVSHQFEGEGPAMLASDLDHRELLEVDPEGGLIRFAGQRALLLDAVAMGLLRKYLDDGNQTYTAKQLRIGSATLYRKLKSYGLIGKKRGS
jgi:DNA-binding NtrC family response regulator